MTELFYRVTDGPTIRFGSVQCLYSVGTWDTTLALDRDVGRTFPSQPLFQSKNGPGQNMLANVLKAFMKINLDVGYCQVRDRRLGSRLGITG